MFAKGRSIDATMNGIVKNQSSLEHLKISLQDNINGIKIASDR